MTKQDFRNHSNFDWAQLKDRLVYLPGAVILVYGMWLTLSV